LLVVAAAKTWRRLKGENLLPKVVAGVRFKGGTEITDAQAERAARSPPSPRFGHSSATAPTPASVPLGVVVSGR